MTGPEHIPWREALKSPEPIRDTGGVILCGKAVVTWEPCEQARAIAALKAREQEQRGQEHG